MKVLQKRIVILSCIFSLIACTQQRYLQQNKNSSVYSGNPVLPGDFADPCILIYKDTFYIYATTGSEATVWRSADFNNWKLTRLNWPTSMHQPDIWAPAVRQGTGGKFYLYTTTNHNIYVGVANHPTGPFNNVLKGDSIFIKNRILSNKMHSIDADCFIDDDGQAYLYWGSGFDFKDGVCAVGILNKDMASFKEVPKLITPEGYFEGPHMMKHKGKYYLMYSDGFYYDSTYKVRYAVSDKPTGPFVQGKNSPILTSTPDGRISGPGHHYTFNTGNNSYILYHRHSYPFYEAQRQVCIDKLEFEGDGSIKKVIATQEGVLLNFLKTKIKQPALKPVSVEASSSLGEPYNAVKAFDGSFGTLWATGDTMRPVWIKADFGKKITFHTCTPIFDRVMGDYNYKIEYSSDGEQWMIYAQGKNAEAAEWPVEYEKEVRARFLRITVINYNLDFKRIGLWEVKIT